MSLDKLKLLVLDVDGVLTDGKLYYGANGDELKAFSSRDGAGIKYLMRAGLECAILSGRDSAALHRRCQDLGIDHVVTGAKVKEPELQKVLDDLGLAPEEAGYVGDDLMDLPPMRAVGWSACPADAVREVREAVDYVADANGGHGAVREIVEHVLGAQDKWDGIMARYRGE